MNILIRQRIRYAGFSNQKKGRKPSSPRCDGESTRTDPSVRNISAEGGVALIGTAKAGTKGAIRLTFSI